MRSIDHNDVYEEEEEHYRHPVDEVIACMQAIEYWQRRMWDIIRADQRGVGYWWTRFQKVGGSSADELHQLFHPPHGSRRPPYPSGQRKRFKVVSSEPEIKRLVRPRPNKLTVKRVIRLRRPRTPEDAA